MSYVHHHTYSENRMGGNSDSYKRMLKRLKWLLLFWLFLFILVVAYFIIFQKG